jgi:hypothetical protein
METLRLQTLPLVNAWVEDDVRVEDFFGVSARSSQDTEELREFTDDLKDSEFGQDLDWSLVDEQLNEPETESE